MLLSCEGSQYADVKMPYLRNMKALRATRAGASSPATCTTTGCGRARRRGRARRPTSAAPGGRTIRPTRRPPPSTRRSPRARRWPTGWSRSARLPTRGQMQIYDRQHSVAQVTAPTQRWIYLPTNPNDAMTPQRTGDAIHDVQHAGRGGGRRAVRARRLHRHPRQGRAGGHGREDGQSEPGRRHAVPDGCRRQDAVRAGEGAGVPVLRSVGVRAARHAEAGAAAHRPAARRPEFAARARGPAARSPPPPPPPPPPPMVD